MRSKATYHVPSSVGSAVHLRVLRYGTRDQGSESVPRVFSGWGLLCPLNPTHFYSTLPQSTRGNQSHLTAYSALPAACLPACLSSCLQLSLGPGGRTCGKNPLAGQSLGVCVSAILLSIGCLSSSCKNRALICILICVYFLCHSPVCTRHWTLVHFHFPSCPRGQSGFGDRPGWVPWIGRLKTVCCGAAQYRYLPWPSTQNKLRV
jgi:hypothetical protein